MRLVEAIVSANHRAVSGDTSAGLHRADHEDSLPVAALTCVDPRLNSLLPGALALENNDFIWLRNAGNIITGPMSGTLRSLALACAIKGAREIMVIGHTDCQVCKTNVLALGDRFRALGVDRAQLPDNLNEFFGISASERQNVIRGTEFIRRSPLIGRAIPVHGLVLDVQSGKLEWIVNGYETVAAGADPASITPAAAGRQNEELGSQGAFPKLADFQFQDLKFPETKIGEIAESARQWIAQAEEAALAKARDLEQAAAAKVEELKQKLPQPPPIPPSLRGRVTHWSQPKRRD